MKKGKILNFEILWDTDKGLLSLAEKYIPMDIKKAADEGYTHIAGIMLNEGLLPFDDLRLQDFFNSLKKQTDGLGIELILLSSLGEKFKNINVPFDVHYFPYHARFVFNSYKDLPLAYYSNSDKFLFLGGAATRSNRIGLLSKFYDAGLLKNAEWSFFKPTYEEDVKWCRDHLSRYTNEEYDEFLETVERSIDERYDEVKLLIKDAVETKSDLDWHNIIHTKFYKKPGYLTPKVFEDTKFSILSEGPNFWTDNYEFVTEKTWRTIINKHPFIFAGPTEQFEYIKSLGFKTFENYLAIQNYAYIRDENERLDAVVENTKHLLTNNDEKIIMDVEYNFNRYLEIIENQNVLFYKLEHDMHIPRSEIDYYLDNEGLDHLIREKDE
jgi:hypothetical protein